MWPGIGNLDTHDLYTPGLYTSHPHQELPSEVTQQGLCCQGEGSAAGPQGASQHSFSLRIHHWPVHSPQSWRLQHLILSLLQSWWDWDTSIPRTFTRTDANLLIRDKKATPRSPPSRILTVNFSLCESAWENEFWPDFLMSLKSGQGASYVMQCSVAQDRTAWRLFLPRRLNPTQFPKSPWKGLFLN